MRKQIRVQPCVIESNLRSGAEGPPIVVRLGDGRELPARAVEIDGPSRVVWDRNGVERAGAHVWVETEAPVRLDGEEIG